MSKLKVGNLVFLLRYGTADSCDRIKSIVDNVAIGESGNSYFIEYDDSGVILPGANTPKFFNITYVVASLRTKETFDADILRKKIRNFDYSKFSYEKLTQINRVLESLNKD